MPMFVYTWVRSSEVTATIVEMLAARGCAVWYEVMSSGYRVGVQTHHEIARETFPLRKWT